MRYRTCDWRLGGSLPKSAGFPTPSLELGPVLRAHDGGFVSFRPRVVSFGPSGVSVEGAGGDVFDTAHEHINSVRGGLGRYTQPLL